VTLFASKLDPSNSLEFGPESFLLGKSKGKRRREREEDIRAKKETEEKKIHRRLLHT